MADLTILSFDFSRRIEVGEVRRYDDDRSVRFAGVMRVRRQAVLGLGLEVFERIVWVELLGAVEREWVGEGEAEAVWDLWCVVVRGRRFTGLEGEGEVDWDGF